MTPAIIVLLWFCPFIISQNVTTVARVGGQKGSGYFSM